MPEKMSTRKKYFNDIVIFDIYKNTFTYHGVKHLPSKGLLGRKHSAGFLLNDHFYMHGGIDQTNGTIDEFIQINLKTFQWKDVDLSYLTGKKQPPFPEYEKVNEDGSLQCCFGHKMCVITQPRKEIELNFLGDIIGPRENIIKYEGIYVFGG